MISSSSSLLAVIAVAFLVAAPTLTVAINPAACELAGCQGGKAAPSGKVNATQSGGNATSSSFTLVPEVIVHAQASQETRTRPVSVDFPGTLKQHVHMIQDYLENPVQYLEQVDFLATLEDLEEQLCHADQAREFHALGGWPLLASLVSSKAHASVVINEAVDDETADELTEKVLSIRAQAAWAMGSAVKDALEFAPWVQEEMGDTTPLAIVVQALLEVSDAAASPGSCSKSTLQFQEELAAKTVYALGSFLRGNPAAQVAFTNMPNNPTQVLGKQVSKWAQEATETAAMVSSNAPMSRHAIKMTQQLLTLANDIVNMASSSSSSNNKSTATTPNAIVAAFTTNEWCQAAMQASTMQPSSSFKRLVFKPLFNTALQSVQTLGPYCSMATTSAGVSAIQ